MGGNWGRYCWDGFCQRLAQSCSYFMRTQLITRKKNPIRVLASSYFSYIIQHKKVNSEHIFGVDTNWTKNAYLEKNDKYEVKYRSNQSLVGNLNFLSQILLKLPSSWYVQVKICLHQKNFSDSASLFWILIKCLHFHIFSICSTSFRLKEPRIDLWLEWSILLIITQKRRSSILQCSLSKIE